MNIPFFFFFCGGAEGQKEREVGVWVAFGCSELSLLLAGVPQLRGPWWFLWLRVGRGRPGSSPLDIGSLLLVTRQTNLFIFAHVYVDFVVSEIGFCLLRA